MNTNDSIDRANEIGMRYGWVEGREAAIQALLTEVSAGRNAPILMPLIEQILKLANPHAAPSEPDGAPYCSYGHKTKAQCDCGPIAANE